MSTTQILKIVGVVCLIVALGAVLDVVAVSAVLFVFLGIAALILATVL